MVCAVRNPFLSEKSGRKGFLPRMNSNYLSVIAPKNKIPPKAIYILTNANSDMYIRGL